jgi:hypothetical protein
MRGRLPGRFGLVLLGYLGAAGVFTWPLALHLGTAIPGDGKDGWQGVWSLWWWATALGQGRNPFHTDLLFHPQGADLYLHTLMPFNGLLALPVQAVGGPVAAYNFIVLVSLVASACGAYWLARDRLARAGALPGGGWGEIPPFAAGLLFGFSPYLADHLLSHLNLLAAEGLPFAVLALLRAGDGGGGLGVGGWKSGARKQDSAKSSSAEPPSSILYPLSPVPTPNPQPPTPRWIAAAVLALLVTALCEWQYVLFLALWTGLWAAWTVGGRVGAGRRGQAAGGWAVVTPLIGPGLAWAGFLLLVSPLIAGMIGQLGSPAAPARTGFAQDTLTYSADLLAYAIPSPFHPWWGAWAAEVLRPFPGTLIEKVMFPTYTAVVLAALGWAVGRRRGWPVGFWAAQAGVFFVLSLGPALHIGGQLLPIPLPAGLLYQLPIANLTRAPGRFVVLVLLALAVLLAFGLAALIKGWGIRGQGWGVGGRGSVEAIQSPQSKIQNPKLVIVLLVLLIVELWPAPYRLARWDVPPGMGTLADLPPGSAVFDVPVAPFETAYMQAQIVHGHPLIGGYLARNPAYPLFAGVPVFTEFATLRAAPDLCAPPLAGLGPGVLAAFTTGAVVLHKTALDDRGLTAARDLAARLGLGAPTREDDRLVIYRPPRPPTLPSWANLDTRTWYDREEVNGAPFRWMGAAGTIHVWRASDGPATLRLRAYSFATPRRFAVTVDGAAQPVITLGPAPELLAIPLPPTAGHTVVMVQALDPPSSPGGTDPRLLSLGLLDCALEPGR